MLHQLLGWHSFYDRSTRTAALVSDGVFHLASTALVAAGLILLLRSGGPISGRRTFGSICVGAGAFNLYDGTVQHKLLHLHEVRPDAADPLPYDLAFNGLAALVLAVGAWLLATSRRRASATDAWQRP